MKITSSEPNPSAALGKAVSCRMRQVLIGTNVAFPFASWVCEALGWTVLGTGLLVSAHALLAGGMFVPSNPWLGPVVSTLPDEARYQNALWLTIDDGPHPEDTPQLLEILDEAKIKATFFFIGKHLERWPALGKEVVRRGHQIGNHTWTHPAGSFWFAGPRKIRAELERSQHLIQEITGHLPTWFRAPAGLKSPFLHPILDQLNLKLLAWSARGNDGVCLNPLKVGKLLEKRMQKRGIVLMHEGRVSTQGGRLAPQVLKRILEIADHKQLTWSNPLDASSL